MKTHIELEELCGIAIAPTELAVELDYDTRPAEPMTHNYPGCDAELELTSVIARAFYRGKEKDTEIINFLSPLVLVQLEEIAIEYETEMNDPGNEP